MKISSILGMLFAAALFVTASPVAAGAADTHTDYPSQSVFLSPDDLAWENAPPGMPPGAKVSVLLGDPRQPGPFVIRFQTFGEYKIPPHYHSKAETLTVLSGTLYLGPGETWDPSKAHAMGVGAFHYLPGKTPHFAFAKAPVVVEIHGHGPFDIVYLNREDDPRR